LRPHQGLGPGEGGEQREEERGTSIWRDFHSVSLVPAHVAFKPSALREGGLVRRGNLAGMALELSPSCWLTFPSSSRSQSVILTIIFNFNCKSPGTTFEIIPGNPKSQGPSSLQISGVPGPALGYPSGAAKLFVIYSGPRTGCTSLI